ncbi:MAG: tetratricopeptide repeat protein, partial [Planctomycetota bacterium]|nr:tetratricopeptide repeat protein [Planctomycetota bacterium]
RGVDTPVQVRAMVTDLTGLTGTDTLILQSENGAIVSSLDSPALSPPEETPEPVVAEIASPEEEPVPEPEVPEPEPELVVELPPAIEFISPEAECILAGDEIEVAWEIREEPADQALDPDAEVILQFYSPASDEWEAVGDATVGAGQLSWVAPELTLVDCRLRLVVSTAVAAADGAAAEDGDGAAAEALEFDSNPFGVDASAPRVACEQFPAVAGGIFSLEVELVDEGCSAPEDVQAFIRAEGEEFWNALDSSRVQLEAAGEKFTVSLQLGEEKEKKYDLYLAATDSLGNVAAAPGVASESIGSFQLDNTPPLVAIGEPGTDWVAGLPAVLKVQVDPSDCSGPLVIEGRAGNEDGEWAELARLDDLALAEDGMNFNVPADLSELEVRVLARDALGNPGYGTLSPRRLKSPVRLDTMTRGGVFQAFDKQKIAWTLQPAVFADTKDLLVRIEYRVGDSGAWEILQEGAPEAQVQSGEFEWVLPDAAEDELTLRVGLYRGQALLGEDVSGSFKIESFTKAEDGVLRESLIALDSAQEKESDWRKRSDEAAPSEELASLAKAAEADYRKALSLDAKNSEASFRLSMLLNDMNPETHSDEILQLLEATIAQEPDNISAQLNLGAVLIQRNELDRAKTVTEKVLEQEDSGQARFNLALALLFKGDGEAARSQFEMALSKGGNVPEGLAWFYIAWSHADEGNMEVARNLYSEKKAVIPDDFKSIIEEKLR